MNFVKSFRDLEVYTLSRKLAKEVFEISKNFPREKMYSLTDQVRRASRSIGGQIVEAWGKRKYEKHFLSNLSDADGEQLETQHWIETALDCLYISPNIAENLLSQCEIIGKMLSSMMSKSSSFCNNN